MHLAIDGYGADREKLEDTGFVYRFLDSFPGSLGMTRVTTPTVFTYHAPKFEDWGVTGFVIIAESHISVHTFPERNLISIDVFSCRDFDTERVAKKIKDIFSLAAARIWVLERGLDHCEPPPTRSGLFLERVSPAGGPIADDGS